MRIGWNTFDPDQNQPDKAWSTKFAFITQDECLIKIINSANLGGGTLTYSLAVYLRSDTLFI